MKIEPLTPQGNSSDPDSVTLDAEDISTKERDAILHADIRDASNLKRRDEKGIPLTAVAARINSSGKTRKQITEATIVALTTKESKDIDIDFDAAILDDAMLTIDEKEEEQLFNEVVEELGGSVEEPAPEVGEPAPESEKPERLGNPLTLEEIFTGARDEKEEDKEGKTDKNGLDEIDR